jgi:phage terminase large subunit-like protein
MPQAKGQPTVTRQPQIVMPGEKRFLPFSAWVEDNFYDPTTVIQYGKTWIFDTAETLKLEATQRRIVDFVLTPNKKGHFPYETIVYSTIKKEGKTTLAGAVGAWFAACIEPPNLILTLANDQEQSAGRIFGAMTPTLNALGCRVPTAVSAKPEVRLPNGTVVQAIANNYAGAAGANYGLTLWSELWAYTTERSRRLYEELVPVPTKKTSIRWVETYVGFEDESELLLDLFLRIFTDTDENAVRDVSPAGHKVVPVPELIDITSDGKPCCYHIPEEGLFYYHNHTPRMPWNVGERGQAYRAKQKAELRPTQYTRLHENRWQSAEGTFITPSWYDDAVTLDGPSLEPMIIAIDGAIRNDTISLVGIKKYHIELFNELVERYKLCYFKSWSPEKSGMKKDNTLGTKKGDMDLEETVGKEILWLYNQGLITGPVWYDPFQMHQIAVKLRKQKIPCVEFVQQSERLKCDTFFAEILRKGELDLYYDPVMEAHIKNAKAKEFENMQIRIVKGTIGRGNKVDAAVATAMALWKASLFRPEVGQKKTSSSYTAY